MYIVAVVSANTEFSIIQSVLKSLSVAMLYGPYGLTGPCGLVTPVAIRFNFVSV
jgi:hypothetical protein